MTEAVQQALQWQADYCRTGGSPFTAEVLEGARDDLARGGPFAAILAPWAEADLRSVIDDAVSLRLAAALHALVLENAAPELAAAYPPHASPADLPARVSAAAAAHADSITAFMRSPPQTNEVRRAMGLFVGFMEVAAITGLPLATFEIGASAGLLTSWDSFSFAAADGSWRWGPGDAPVAVDAEWRGPAPRLTAVTVASRRACDIAPVRVADPAQRRRLEAYVWPDQPDRLARLRAAADLAQAQGVEVEAADAGPWLAENLHPQPGVATVLYHAVMFQYLPPASKEAAVGAIVRAAAAATVEAPFAWLRSEPTGGDARRRMEVRLALFPSGGERVLATAHAHAAWIDTTGA